MQTAAAGRAARGKPARVLLVGPAALDRDLVPKLEAAGHEVDWRRSFPQALSLDRTDVVIVALSAEEDSAIGRYWERVREAARPALLVLHEGGGEQSIALLDAGADDCLPWPHNPREVLARMRAILRRRAKGQRPAFDGRWFFDGHMLDVATLRFRASNGRELRLSPAQGRLLISLLERPREVVARDDLLDAVLGPDAEVYPEAISLQVFRLRKHLARVTDADVIRSYRGVGYFVSAQEVAWRPAFHTGADASRYGDRP